MPRSSLCRYSSGHIPRIGLKIWTLTEEKQPALKSIILWNSISWSFHAGGSILTSETSATTELLCLHTIVHTMRFTKMPWVLDFNRDFLGFFHTSMVLSLASRFARLLPVRRWMAKRCQLLTSQQRWTPARSGSDGVTGKMIMNIWLVVWLPFFAFPYIGIYWVANHPNWLSYIFQRGWNHQPAMRLALFQLESFWQFV